MIKLVKILTIFVLLVYSISASAQIIRKTKRVSRRPIRVQIPVDFGDVPENKTIPLTAVFGVDEVEQITKTNEQVENYEGTWNNENINSDTEAQYPKTVSSSEDTENYKASWNIENINTDTDSEYPKRTGSYEETESYKASWNIKNVDDTETKTENYEESWKNENINSDTENENPKIIEGNDQTENNEPNWDNENVSSDTDKQSPKIIKSYEETVNYEASRQNKNLRSDIDNQTPKGIKSSKQKKNYEARQHSKNVGSETQFPKRTEEATSVVPIIENENYVFAHNGDYHYSYKGGDGTSAFERGGLRAPDDGTAEDVVEGGYSYKDKDGNDYSLTYTAGENGYRPVGAHLPTPPPIPPAILRVLRILATKTTPEPVTESLNSYDYN